MPSFQSEDIYFIFVEKSTRFGFLLIRMFVVGTGVPDGPQNTNFGRELVFSADLWYNGITS